MRLGFTSAAAVVGGWLGAEGSDLPAVPDYLYTVAPQYAPDAWMDGRDRFPANVLFAARRTARDRWSIWETPLAGGTPRPLTHEDADCVRPLYLPDGRIAYTRITAKTSDIEVLAPGGQPERLTYSPARCLTAGVLRDGLILYESAGDLFTIYPDGTGVETFRCDHGPRRSSPRQVSTGDIIFNIGGHLARFTSAPAEQLDDLAPPDGEPVGPVAEVSPDRWLVSNLLYLNVHESKPVLTADVRSVRVYAKLPAPTLLGQAPVEPDGSFYVEVPADSPLRLELLDAAGEVVRAESGWFWMRPSEQRVCVGCHAGPERAPDNRVPAVLLKSTVPTKLLGRQP